MELADLAKLNEESEIYSRRSQQAMEQPDQDPGDGVPLTPQQLSSKRSQRSNVVHNSMQNMSVRNSVTNKQEPLRGSVGKSK